MKNIDPIFHKGYARIPNKVFNHNDYICLAYSAKALLFEIIRQFKGKNNGDLSIALSIMKPRGFPSSTTIQKAKNQLIERKLIIETRKGIAGIDGRRVASLYAVTWLKVDKAINRDGSPKHHKFTDKPPRLNWG